MDPNLLFGKVLYGNLYAFSYIHFLTLVSAEKIQNLSFGYSFCAFLIRCKCRRAENVSWKCRILQNFLCNTDNLRFGFWVLWFFSVLNFVKRWVLCSRSNFFLGCVVGKLDSDYVKVLWLILVGFLCTQLLKILYQEQFGIGIEMFSTFRCKFCSETILEKSIEYEIEFLPLWLEIHVTLFNCDY